MQDQIDSPVRQAAVIYLKNTITQNWTEKQVTQPSEPVPFSIHETDKAHIREHLIEAVIRAPPPIRYFRNFICVVQSSKKPFINCLLLNYAVAVRNVHICFSGFNLLCVLVT